MYLLMQNVVHIKKKSKKIIFFSIKTWFFTITHKVLLSKNKSWGIKTQIFTTEIVVEVNGFLTMWYFS